MFCMTRPTDIFLALSDPLRRRVAALLAAKGELCVCELTAALDESQPKVSRHLALLRDVGLVQVRRDGRWMLYSLAPDLPQWAAAAVAAAAAARAAEPGAAEDAARLTAFAGRPEETCCDA
jgi:ArsR family transcriptional regulator